MIKEIEKLKDREATKLENLKVGLIFETNLSEILRKQREAYCCVERIRLLNELEEYYRMENGK